MRSIPVLIGAVLLITSPGFSKTLITAQDYSVDSDVALESAVREIKSIPRDTINVIGDTVKYAADETVVAAKGVAAVFKGKTPREKAQIAGELDVENAWISSEDILFRSYKVSDEVGSELMKGLEAAKGAAMDVSDVFGIDFPENTSAYYRSDFKKLSVHHTQRNLLAIEDLLAELHHSNRELMGHQVEIETKFVEVSQKTLNELGFRWEFLDHNGGGLELINDLLLPAGSELFSSGLRTAASALNGGVSDSITIFRDGNIDIDLVINAMEQADDTDVLSAPSIVTRNGKEAIIEVGEERMVPVGLEVDSKNTSLFIQHKFARKPWLVGVSLEVKPELRDGGLIDLNLKPKVLGLIGYDNYQMSPGNAAVWPIHGYNFPNAMNTGRYPVLTGVLDAGGNLVENSLGKLYREILKSADSDSGEIISENINDYEFQAGETDNNYYYESPYYAYQDNRRNWDKSELIAVPALHGYLPYFRLREMQTDVTVADGNTVGMGGLIYDKLETYRDKVPVLGSIPFIGRLFRSEGEKSIKRNLMIFVTATQVDTNGRRNADLTLKK